MSTPLTDLAHTLDEIAAERYQQRLAWFNRREKRVRDHGFIVLLLAFGWILVQVAVGSPVAIVFNLTLCAAFTLYLLLDLLALDTARTRVMLTYRTIGRHIDHLAAHEQ